MSPTSATPTPSENGDHSHHRFSLREFMSSLVTHKGKNKPDEVRNYLLVVATLIAAVTFQAGVNPPGGVWQDNSNNHRAGQAIYASNFTPFYVFLTFNTLALSSSLFLMINLTWGFPFFLEVVIATVSMLNADDLWGLDLCDHAARDNAIHPASKRVVHCGGSDFPEDWHSGLQVCHCEVRRKM